MLTKKDIKNLVGIKNNSYALIKYTFIAAIIILSINAIYNLYLSINYASLYGLSFSKTVSLWSEEASLEKIYSGLEHHSILSLNKAIFSFGASIVIGIQFISIITLRNRNERILLALIKCGEINKEEINL